MAIRAALAVAALVLVGVLAWFLTSSPAVDEERPATSNEVVVVRDATPPQLEAPAPPPLAGVVEAPADAFVGGWRDPAGERLRIERRGATGYAVTIVAGEATETYDGTLTDGRIQIVRGIDGEWIQAVRDEDGTCLQLGEAQRFCRE